jgi:hypoxanthine phosphoribosyltransferase
MNTNVYSRHKYKQIFDPFKNNAHLVNNKSILLVDNVADSGNTFNINLNSLKEHSPKAVKTCALHYLSSTKIIPDISAYRVSEWRWICFPWDIEKLKNSLTAEIEFNNSAEKEKYLIDKYRFEENETQ